jgi:uncharacterized membrane protein YesL
MTVEVLLIALVTISSLSALVAEAVKKILDEYKKTYKTNTLVGICSLVVAIVVSALYLMYTGVPVTLQIIASFIAITLLSWLCAMVGYDKVIQAFSQFKK